LNAKVDADKKQHGGIPQDLRQLMAAYDIAQGKQNMGIQQALQIPTNMPTVNDDMQERARQALQARAMQQAQEMQRKNGMPNIVPPGTPRPPMQPQGLDSLRTNVGEGYAHGGIIGHTQHFDGTSSSFVKDLASLKDKIVGAFTETDEDKTARLLQQRLQQEGAPIGYFTKGSEDYDKKSALRAFVIDNPMVVKNPEFQANPLAFMEKSKNVNTAGDVNVGNKPYVPNERADEMETNKLLSLSGTPSAPAVSPTNVSAPKPPATQTQTRVNTDNAPLPGGLKDLVSTQATPGGDYQRKMLNQDEEALAAAKRAAYMKEVGSRDLSIYDQMAQELKARKERLNAPKPGYDAMMEYLEQVALGGGRSSAEAGARGANRQRQLQADRLSQQDTLMERILDLGAKKAEAQYGEKKGMFELTQGEKDRIIKEKQEAAKQLGLSEDKTRELIEQGLQKELDRKNRITTQSMANHDNLMSRARALMAADPTKKMTLEQAMQRAGELGSAAGMESADVRRLAAYNAKTAKLAEQFPEWSMRDTPEGRKTRARYEKELAQARIDAGLSASGLNALPGATPSGTVPAVGTVMEGYKFKGGNPRDQNNWEKV
jgi:hypothetical protein